MLIANPISPQLNDYPTAHCATLVELPDGDLLAAWFGGAYETAPDVVILAARYRSTEGGWSPPQVIADAPQRSMGQPVFLARPDGELWLFFNVIMDRDWTSAQPYWQRSIDGGRTWRAAEQLLDYPGLMFRSRPCTIGSRVILPVYDEQRWQSRMMISDDGGASWRLTALMETPQGNIHPCIVDLGEIDLGEVGPDGTQLDSGRLLAYMRTGGKGGVIWRSTSLDRAETWSRPQATTLPNPNSGIDLLRLDSGALVLAFNDSPRKRTPLCVAIAVENEQFDRMRTLEDDDAEFSYPTLLQASDGRIHMVYTNQRKTIQHATFSEAWLKHGEMRG